MALVLIYWSLATVALFVTGLRNRDMYGTFDKWVFSAPWWLNIGPTGAVGVVAQYV